MPTSVRIEKPLLGLHLAHVIMVLGVAATLYGLKFHGPYSFFHLEGLALSLYGLSASVVELAIILAKMPQNSHRIDLWHAFLFESHMVLVTVAHGVIFFLFRA